MAKTSCDYSKGDIQKHADKLLELVRDPRFSCRRPARVDWQGPLQIPRLARHFAEANNCVASVRRGIDDTPKNWRVTGRRMPGI